MIKVRDLTKFYGKFLALNNLNFEISRGEITAFLGPNGAGKTTTMRILTGFLRPTAGTVTINGIDVFEEPEKVKSMLGYLPETPPVYPELTVREYLTFAAEIKKVPHAEIKAKVDNAIELAGLGERRNTLIGLLSKGFRQRAGIAQSIVNKPEVLILDEPTVGLDPMQIIEIRGLIRDLSREEKRTVILSTHILAEANEICSKAIIINDGSIVAVDNIESLKAGPEGGHIILIKVAREKKGLIEMIRKIESVGDVREKGAVFYIHSSEDVREKIAETVTASGAGLLELSRKEGSLEDIFVNLMTGREK